MVTEGNKEEAPELFQLRFSLLDNSAKVSRRENGESEVLVLWPLEPTLWPGWSHGDSGLRITHVKRCED